MVNPARLYCPRNLGRFSALPGSPESGDFFFFVGNRIPSRIICSVPLTRKTFALFSGLDLNGRLFGGFKCFEVLMSPKTYQGKKSILLWRVKHYFWWWFLVKHFSWWRISVSVVCMQLTVWWDSAMLCCSCGLKKQRPSYLFLLLLWNMIRSCCSASDSWCNVSSA